MITYSIHCDLSEYYNHVLTFKGHIRKVFLHCIVKTAKVQVTLWSVYQCSYSVTVGAENAESPVLLITSIQNTE